MRFLIVIVGLLSVLSRPCFASAQAGQDSIVTFRFMVHQEVFMADYFDNRNELHRLGEFIQSNREKIMRGEFPIYVDGYCSSASMARLRSNHVKSYMVLRYGLDEQNFRTQNHEQTVGGKTDVVIVAFCVPHKAAPAPAVVARHPRDSVSVYDPVTVVATQKMTFIPKVQPLADLMRQEREQLAFESKGNYALLEKGAYYVSLAANFNDASTANMLIEPLFDVHSIYNRTLNLEAAVGYFVKNNVALGLYGGYKLTDIRVEVSSDLLQLLINSKKYQTSNVSSGYTLGAFTKTFIPLEYRHKVFLVNEASIFFEQFRSLSRNVYDDGAMLSKVYQNTYRGGVKLSVGVMLFLFNGMSLDFNISPVAAMYQYNEVLNNETLNGAFAAGAINTILLPIDLKFSLTYFFGLDYRKNRAQIRQWETRTK